MHFLDKEGFMSIVCEQRIIIDDKKYSCYIPKKCPMLRSNEIHKYSLYPTCSNFGDGIKVIYLDWIGYIKYKHYCNKININKENN